MIKASSPEGDRNAESPKYEPMVGKSQPLQCTSYTFEQARASSDASAGTDELVCNPKVINDNLDSSSEHVLDSNHTYHDELGNGVEGSNCVEPGITPLHSSLLRLFCPGGVSS